MFLPFYYFRNYWREKASIKDGFFFDCIYCSCIVVVLCTLVENFVSDSAYEKKCSLCYEALLDECSSFYLQKKALWQPNQKC